MERVVQNQILQKKIVDLVRTVKAASAIILQYNIHFENTDLYTVKERIDYHGSWIDQAAHVSYDC